MKNLNTVFDLLLFPFLFLKRKGLLFSLLFVAGTALFASNTPVISISPADINVSEGDGTTVSVDLNISIDVAPDTADINVTWKTTDGSATVANGNYVSDTDTITFTQGSGTSSQTITITVNSDVNITGDIAFFVTFSADANASQTYDDTQNTASIAIINNKPPTANNKTYQVSINNASLTGNIITDAPADTDPENDPITFVSSSSPSNSITIVSDGNFTYIPNTNFCGIDSFDYNITDGRGGNDTATITIDNIGNTLTPVDDYFATPKDSNTTQEVLSNDGNTSYTVVSFSQPPNGTVTNNGNGYFTYSPDTNFGGLDTFDYNVTDGTCSTATATVTINVAQMCGGTEYWLCENNNSMPQDINSTPKVLYFDLKQDAIVDINLSNNISNSGTGLVYDFKKTNCGDLFSTTASKLAKGKTVNIKQKYSAGIYYFGFYVDTNGSAQTDINLSICYDENLSSGGDDSFFSPVGINDAGNSYANLQDIRTKLVNKNFGLKASHLDENGSMSNYDGGEEEWALPVSLSLVDGGGNIVVPSSIIYLEINHNTPSVEMLIDGNNNYLDGDGGISGKIPSNPNVVDYAAKIRRYEIASLDFGNILRGHDDLKCKSSSPHGCLCKLPACLCNGNASQSSKIREVFPPAFFPYVLTCLNGDGGGAAPCKSSAYSGSCGGVNTPISPSKYNNYLGCFQCLRDAMGPPIYSDDFAIRPREFDVNISNGDILRAGKLTSLAFEALDGREAGKISTLPLPALPSDEYNETQGTTFYVDLNVSNNSDCQVKELTITPNVSFRDGNHTDNFTFDDIGDINMSIHETNGTEFAIVDVDDTPLHDVVNGSGIVIIDGRLIHKKDVNFTVIPHHFDINTTLTNHNKDNNFTYISADLNMSSTLDINITAQGEDNETTVNYTENCYAYPVDLNISLAYSSYPMTPNTLDPLLYLLTEENNAYTKEGNTSNTNIKNIDITDPADLANLPTSIFPAGDHNGTADLMFKLNFDRKYNKVVNPFEMNVTDINVLDDKYPDDNVTGAGAPDTNATYYYARTKPSKYLYDNEASPVNTPISVVVYNDPITSTFSPTSIFTPTNEYEWYLSTGHISDNDGNITLEALSAGGSINPADPNIVNISGGVNNSVTVTCSAGTVVDITFGDDTNNWMIYNEDNDSIPNPFYRVQCIGISGWAGHGDTGHVVEDEPSSKNSRRLGW